MPIAAVGELNMYYEIHGEGEPLLLLNGLGSSLRTWLDFAQKLARRAMVIACDNRGVGRTDRPDAPYTIAGMAADAAGLLEHLGIASAHVAGLSMGGYIAQEMAINHPRKVGKLILMATHAGGPDYLEATKCLWGDVLDVKGLSRDEVILKGIRWSVRPGFYEREGETVRLLLEAKLQELQPAYAFQRQFQAALLHDTRARLHSITSPTLVVGGRDDRLVPPAFVKRLADAIHAAKLLMLDTCAHMVFLEAGDETAAAIARFLDEPVTWAGFVRLPGAEERPGDPECRP